MSLPSRSSLQALRRIALAGLVCAIPALSACTVRPLYSSQTDYTGEQTGVMADLSSINVIPVQTRYAQEVRNHLIFAFNSGKGQPASPRYTLTLVVTEAVESAAVIQVGEDNRPTSGTLTLTVRYRLADASTRKAVGTGVRRITASYDLPQQEFAAYRAQIDAENRAARELAELLKLVVAQDLSRASR